MSIASSASAMTSAAGRPRPAEEVLKPVDLGGARSTRHSFARSLIRRAAAHGWRVTRERFQIDENGCGTAVYRVDAEGNVWTFVAFSQNVGEAKRTDRVIAESWDVTAALVEGEVHPDRMRRLREQVPLQEAGRADGGTVIWTRANRSERFFDYAIDRLASGQQPEAEVFGCSPYLMRSTAFYSNGKFGLADFERFRDGHPFAVPYRAHMLTAWLLRELSYDVVEHCALARSTSAVAFDGAWRRYLGLGNATGLGMVPYVINHPRILDAWIRMREIPLASVLARDVSPTEPDVGRVQALLARAIGYFEEQRDLSPTPYLPGPVLAHQLSPVLTALNEFASGEQVHATGQRVWQTLHDAAHETGPECRGVVASILTELTGDLDALVESGLRCDERRRLDPRARCGDLLTEVAEHYGWVDAYDFAERTQVEHFWFSSANSEEPRRARLGIDPGEDVQHGVDIARSVAALRTDLQAADPNSSIALFLLEHPWHRSAVSRAQTVVDLEYAEVRDNLLAAEFLPLHLQRLQLAAYGMENFNPQSTDWLRVTLFSGAPRVAELPQGTADDDWMFTPRPSERLIHARLA